MRNSSGPYSKAPDERARGRQTTLIKHHTSIMTAFFLFFRKLPAFHVQGNEAALTNFKTTTAEGGLTGRVQLYVGHTLFDISYRSNLPLHIQMIDLAGRPVVAHDVCFLCTHPLPPAHPIPSTPNIDYKSGSNLCRTSTRERNADSEPTINNQSGLPTRVKACRA